jgi:thiosulfate/3-mercaptopyruvate sulfurtransferase
VRPTTVLIRSVLAFSIAAPTLAAQNGGAREALLVTPAWLSTHLKDPNLVILHVGIRDKYAAKHIPGARFIDMSDVAVSDMSGMGPMPAGMPTPPITGPKNGLSLEMPTAEQLQSQLAKFGISDDSRIVIYMADEYVSPSTRIAFTLDYVGLGKNTVMLDGGLPAWIANGGELSDAVPPPAKPGKLSTLALRPIVVDAEFVRDRASKPGIALIDARAPMFWAGTPPSTGGASGRPQPPPGHIPGATNIPFDTMIDDAGKLKSPDELAAIFARAGVKPGDTIVAYCHVGGQATTVLFAARTLGHPVLLYDGSMNDWNKRGNPLELPEKAKP